MVLAVVSGGLDSTVLAHFVEASVWVTFRYGQRHIKEVESARRLAEGVEWILVDLPLVLSGSALTDDISVPYGRYDDESMAVTIVPNRNAIFLSVACGMAIARGMKQVAIGVHGGDHVIYPDCRPQFIRAFQKTVRLGTGKDLEIVAPFVNKTKAEIVMIGHELGVPFELTWSCYEGREVHCGLCGTCHERREAFQLAGVTDPTIYASTG